MKMNRLEKLAMNNPVRTLIQRHYEAPLLERLGGRLDDLVVLETGCGRGIGTETVQGVELTRSTLDVARGAHRTYLR